MTKYQEARFRWNLGIHQQPNFAQPDHLKDARNVWAPEGEVRLRPGIENLAGDNELFAFGDGAYDMWSSNAIKNTRAVLYYTGGDFTTESGVAVTGAVVDVGDAMAQGDIFYYGFSEDPSNPIDAIENFGGIYGQVTSGGGDYATDDLKPKFIVEYWNGTKWMFVPSSTPGFSFDIADLAAGGKLATASRKHCQDRICFRPGADWATSEVHGLTRYWVRARVLNNPTQAIQSNINWDLDIPIVLPGTPQKIYDGDPTTGDYGAVLSGCRTVRMSQGQCVVFAVRLAGLSSSSIGTLNWLGLRFGLGGSSFVNLTIPGHMLYAEPGTSDDDNSVLEYIGSTAPVSIAAVPEQNRIYIAMAHNVSEWRLDKLPTLPVDNTLTFEVGSRTIYEGSNNQLGASHKVSESLCRFAAIETAHSIVGDDSSDYARQYLAQESSFPKAAAIVYHDERLFMCNIKGQPRRLQWGGAGDAMRVFPLLGYTYVPGTLPLLGFFTLGESLYTYDAESIWKIVFSGLDAFEIPHYDVVRVVAGSGPIAPGTIVSFRGGICYLSRDGLISFDGVRARLVTEYRSKGQTTDRLSELWQSVNWGSAAILSSAVDWKDRGHILVALPTGGSVTPSTILAWDYENNSLWLWDMPIVGLFDYTVGVGKQEIGVVGTDFRLHKLCDRKADFEGAISATLTPHRIGQGQQRTKKLREVEVTTDTNSGIINLEVTRQGSETAKSFTFTPTDETGMLEIDTLKVLVNRERHIKKQVDLVGEYFKLRFTSSDRTDWKIRDVYVRWLELGTR